MTDLSASEVITFTGGDQGDLVNVSSTLAWGDFNDDGEPDVLIGAPQADGPDDRRTDAGEAYVLFGPVKKSRELGAGKADVTVFGAAAGDGLGFSVLAGDLNGDGADDALIGAPGVTAGFDPRSDQGRVYVFFGGKDFGDEPERDLSEDVFDFTVTGAEGFSRLGHAMDVGDVNGDGTQDLVVGAPFGGRVPGSPPGGERTALGEVYVIFGGEDLSGEKNIARDEFDVLLSGETPFGQFGASLAVADVNGDEVEDVVVGAYRGNAGPQRVTSGAVYVFFGGDGLTGRLLTQKGDQDVMIAGEPGSSLGFPMAAGDFDGDAAEDLALGAQLMSSGTLERQGALYVIRGSEDMPRRMDVKEAATVVVTGGMTAELFPSSLAAGDVDGDGAADIVAGSALAPAGDDRPGGGVVRVFRRVSSLQGEISLDKETAALTVLGRAAGDGLGSAVAVAGLKDGGAQLLALAAAADGPGGSNDVGAVYVIPVSE